MLHSQREVLHWQPPSSKNPTHCAPTSHKAIPNGNQYEDGRKRKSYWGNELQEEMEGRKGKGDCCCRLLAHSLSYLLNSFCFCQKWAIGLPTLRTTHVGLDGLPLECPRTCVISPIYAEGAKLLYAFDSSNTMLTKLQRTHLRWSE